MFALALLHWSRPRARSFTSQPLSSLRHLISSVIHDVEFSQSLVAMECRMMKSPQPWNVLSLVYGACARKCVATRRQLTSAIERFRSTINSTTSSTGTFNVARLSASQLFHSLFPSKIHGWILSLLLHTQVMTFGVTAQCVIFDKWNMVHGAA